MRRYLWAIITALSIVGLALWFGVAAVKENERARSGTRTQTRQPQAKTMTLYKGRVSGRRDGRPFWRFDSERIEQGLNGGPTTFCGLHDGVIYRSGKPYITFTADRARYDPGVEQIHLTGSLVAVFPEGTLRTTEAVWHIRDERLIVEVPVEVEGKSYQLSAGGMEVDLPSETARFLKGVVLTRSGQTTAHTETMTHSLKDGMFEVPGPFSLEVEVDEAAE